MTQVNRYTNRAAYEADTARLRTQSAVSHIDNESATLYDGVNVVVGKPAAAVGDLAVCDRTDGVIKFIKSATIRKAQIPANLVPLAVVYARQGERLLVVSLGRAYLDGTASISWAAPYEVALSGFNLVGGGNFTLRIGPTETTFTYAAGATLADIAATIAANMPNYNVYNLGGWTASVSGQEVIMKSASNNIEWSTIEAVSGCVIRRTSDDMNYQITLTRVLIDGTAEYILRKNGFKITTAGCNPGKYLEYYSENGLEKSGLKPGSSGIIRESFFTQEANPELVAAYPTYRDYLFGEHMLQYPSAYGAMLRDGKENTAKIGGLRFVDIHGRSVPRYPAAAAALQYGVTVEGATTGLEAGAWWVPSADEIYLLMHDRATKYAERESDPVNLTLERIGGEACYGTTFYTWTSCESTATSAYIYGGNSGTIGVYTKYNTFTIRPVSAL